MKKKTVIKLENVFKTYDLGKIKLEILKNISLEIEEGDFNVIVGSSGSGKSTLLNLISCLDVPTKGKIFLDGEDVSNFSQDKLAVTRSKKIGFVFQKFNLLNHLTAFENVFLPTVFSGMKPEKAEKEAVSYLEMMGLKSRMNHKPNELSGGENQRVAIARALVNSPEIIVTDEPTGNLDSKTGETIMKILTGLNEKGKTVIMVTHDQDLIKYGNKTIKIKDGEIEKNE